MTRESETTFLQALTGLSPSLHKAWVDHETYNGEIIPHVLMGEMTSVIVELKDNDPGAFRDVLQCIDASWAQADEKVQNLIAVSFLENLPSTGQKGVEVRDHLSPTLLKEYWEVNF